MSVSGTSDGKIYFYLEESVNDKVNFHEEFCKSGIAEAFENFSNRLIGLANVKKKIIELAMYILVQLIRKRMDLQDSTLQIKSHMSFTGNSGTGKTLVARQMALVVQTWFNSKSLVVVAREYLVGQYIGHTAPKTKAVFKKAQGFCLNEANTLHKNSNAPDYGAEVIEILLQHMERFRVKMIVVFAGYKLQMEVFFKKNLVSFSNFMPIDFPDYTMIELMLIAFLTCKKNQYLLNQEATLAL